MHDSRSGESRVPYQESDLLRQFREKREHLSFATIRLGHIMKVAEQVLETERWRGKRGDGGVALIMKPWN
jgi:hypothetical protein